MEKGKSNPPRSFRLSKTALAIISALSRKLGLNRVGVIELALRDMAVKYDVTIDPQAQEKGEGES